MPPKGRYIKAEELVPRKKPKIYDEDLIEIDTLHFWPVRGCVGLPPITYTSKEIQREASRAYRRGLNSVQ